MAYQSWSVVFGEQPSAAKWNILGTNDAAFNDGSGIPTANSSSATISTSQTLASSSYTDLATVGPSVTVTIGSSGKAIIIISAHGTNDTSGGSFQVGVDISGANSVAATSTKALIVRNSSGAPDSTASFAYLHTGLSAGSTTFKLKYANSAGTATISDRTISVITL